jgi:predicted ABC-type ATPase
MPNLIIIAGCNGAGKSVFAPSFLPDGLFSFDYDKLFLQNYNSLSDIELREVMAKNKTTQTFECAIENALNGGNDFCYETNFDQYPLYWAEKFKEKGFVINLIFFCLENQQIARYRVQIRKANNGHFVNNKTIDLKWKAGYKNLNANYAFFDNILIVDNSIDRKAYTNILQIVQGELILMTNRIPEYFKHRLPNIYNLLPNCE